MNYRCVNTLVFPWIVEEYLLWKLIQTNYIRVLCYIISFCTVSLSLYVIWYTC